MKRRSPAVALVDGLLAGYQAALSPFLGGQCRFVPSCSQYAREAVGEHGAAHGLWLAVRRLSRCHPLGAAGFDPVPRVHVGGCGGDSKHE